ncbi:MAG TPA: peroxidase-related enzyme [Planctomycetota bacterium]
MAFLPIVEESAAKGVAAEVFTAFRRTKGTPFVPNFFKTLASAPTVAQGTWNVYRDVGHYGDVPRTIKEMLFVAISQARDCKYCEAAHLAICRLFGIDKETLETLTRDLASLKPGRTRDVIRFGVKAALDPQSVSQEDYDVLRRHGLSDAEIVEVIGMAAFSVYANIVADATRVEIDPAFEEILKA